MPDTRSHRGLAPEDELLFSAEAYVQLRAAATDLCWLLDRGYSLPSAVELVGNRYALSARQRMAVARSVASRDSVTLRRSKQIPASKWSGADLWIDGLNVLTGLEVALSGGVILVGADGCCRDVAGLHRHYRKVEETEPALRLVGQVLSRYGIRSCRWFLDRPVSNTGRLRTLILKVAAEAGWSWEAELVYSPDAVLVRSDALVATADSAILDRCSRWANLVRRVICERLPQTRLIQFDDLLAEDSPKQVAD